VRTTDGTITTFDPKNSQGVWPLRVNKKGAIIGYYEDANFNIYGFFRKPSGKVISLDKQGIKFADGINNRGDICGSLQDHQAFFRTSDGIVTEIDPPGAVSSGASAINDDETLSGAFKDAAGHYHGFIRAADGNMTSFDVPDSTDTYSSDMNASGTIVGSYADAAGAFHGYIRDSAGIFTEFQFSNDQTITEVDALHINDKGYVAGHFRNPANQQFIAFERKPTGKMIYLLTDTYSPTAFGINNHDVIVGGVWGTDNAVQGYFRTP